MSKFHWKKYPTDLELLELIHEEYFDEFCRYDLLKNSRSGKIHVPIDCQLIANKFGTNGDIVFGRLHYDLANKYCYKTSEKHTVRIFEFKVGDDLHCVNFPLLNSLVAGLRSKHRRDNLTKMLSLLAVIISLSSLIVSIWDKL